MAKKKSRKSRRSRKSQSARVTQPQPQVAQPTPTTPSETPVQTSQKKSGGRRVSASDFVKEYAYVYFDLRKMFTVAALMFALLIIINLILTRLVVL